MSQLEKLAVLGIRSFDNSKAESLKFETPLTLIVGLNGSGKTTIIECLKYATTGDMPPNSRGGAFVHDPSICGEKEVMGQVKVMFKSTSQVKMVVTRSMQLTVKKNSRTFKTLDGSLLMMRGGERVSVSTRVAEMDRLMPQNLGVSKSILQYVIFCHQDESLWPMSEPALLKKKFDEIFEAEKYTKAIENIKTIRTTQGNRLTNLKEADQRAKENKARADKAEKAAKELSSELDTLRDEIQSYKEKSKDAEVKAKHAWDEVFKHKGVLDKLKFNLDKRDFHQERIEELKRDLKERNESDEWLRSELENYEGRARTREERSQQLKNQYAGLSTDLDRSRGQWSKKHAENGRYEQLETDQQDRVAKRKSLVQENSRL